AEVQRRLSGTPRVCSYDRAGLGWSESGDRPFDPARVPVELQTLLARANEPGPFVVAGQGLGAAFARMYAARRDSAAAGLVLIDPPPPEAASSQADWIMPASPWLARAGVLRAGRILSSRADGLANGGALRAFLNRPDHLTQAAAEIEAWNETVKLAAAAQPAAGTAVVTVDLGDRGSGNGDRGSGNGDRGSGAGRDRIAFLTSPAAVD